jgi:tRNA threonylcarbamoyladenosine biosynthesis protein TsaE
MKEPITVNLNGIPALAKRLAKSLKGGEIFALVGPLGSGKTTFTKALGKALKVKQTITSPTFIILRSLPGRLFLGQKITLNHLDIYRTKNFEEIKALGTHQQWGSKDTITVIEWANKIKKHLPKKTRVIKFIQK